MRLFRPKPSDAEMDEELRAHFEMRVDRNIADGMTPDEARRVAQKQFGWIESLKEDCWDAHSGKWLDDFRRDISFAIRSLRKNLAFTLVVIATLAVGTGANTAVFSLVNAALLRPLPFREPDRLVWISNPEPGSAGVPGMTRSVTVRDWRERAHSFERLGCYIAWFGRQQTVLSLNGESFRVEGAFIDREFLPTLGVSPQMGREFADDDDFNSALLTHRFWKTRFNSNPAIVGTAMTISGRSWTIVGVLPESFDFSSIFAPGPKPIDFLRPAPHFGDLSDNSHAVIGRLKPGITLRQAQAELDGINAQIRSADADRGAFGARLVPLREHVSGDFRLSFAILSATVLCVLLIACANLSNLLLARAASRRQEWAVRMALGAGRSRLLRQMLAESLLLSFVGAAGGLFLANVATNAIVHSRVFFIPLLSTAHVDRPALFFTIAAASLMALILGVVPALQLSRITLRNDLKEASRGLSEGASHASFRAFLIVAQVAVACVLLVGAGLLIQSFVHITKVDLGFQPGLTFACRVRTNRDFKTNSEAVVYFNELSQRIHALPGVESVGFTRVLPLGSREIINVRPKGATYRPDEAPIAFIQDGDPGFFQTLRIPLLSGRNFNLDDASFDPVLAPNATPSVILNEKLARDLWPHENAAGQTLFLFENGNVSSALSECKVVGVVGNVRHSPLEIAPAPQIYFYNAGGTLLVRTRGELPSLAAAIREVFRQVDSDIILEDFRPLTQMVDEIISPRRLIMLMAGGFAVLALLLAVIGIYGVIAYSVSRRTHEIGIRLAVGASRANVIGLIVNQGMRLALLGCLIGLVGAAALTRFAQSMLFGVGATDPIAFAASALLLLLTALAASGLPAFKASRTDVIATLRQD